MSDSVSRTPTLLGVTIEYQAPNNWLVEDVWADVDRPCTGGWAVRTGAIALRLANAIAAGKVYPNPQYMIDIRGRSYIGGPDALPPLPLEQALDEIEATARTPRPVKLTAGGCYRPRLDGTGDEWIVAGADWVAGYNAAIDRMLGVTP